MAALIEEVKQEGYPDVENTGLRLVEPESCRLMFRIFDTGSSQQGCAVLQWRLATQQASTTPAAASYQPATGQTLQVDCATPTHQYAAIFYHMYYIHV